MATRKKKRRFPSKSKARKMLKEDQAQGQPLSKAQKGLFGLLASGKTPTKVRKKKRRWKR